MEGPCGLCTCEKGVEGPGSNALAEGTKGQWVLWRVLCLEAGMQPLVGCPCRGGSVRSRRDAGTRRGGHRAWSGRVVASLAAGGQAAAWEHLPRALQHPGKAGSSLGKGVELLTCSPVVFASSCLASACFPQGSSCSPARSPSLQALGPPDAGPPWSCLSPTPHRALSLLPGAGTPFPRAASAAHLHPPCFV